MGRAQEATIINEAGLYSLILTSKLPTAKKFKKWVTSEVLPSIRRHGAYATETTIESIIANPDNGIRLLVALKEEQNMRKRNGHYFVWLELVRTIAIGFHITVVYAILRGIASIIREMQTANTKLK